MSRRIILDSGAFTASRQGDAIDLREYICFARRNLPLLEQIINLDIIPNRDMNTAEIENACVRSYANQRAMKDAGLNPLPVVHQLDAQHWLERYLEDREPYVALAPKGQGSFNWLSHCFKTIAQASYSPKVHGLAVTNTNQWLNFQWATVDSSTWVKQAAVGQVLVPLFDGTDQPLYHLRPRGVFVTERMKIERNHVDRLRDYEREDVLRFLQLCGLSLNAVRQSHQARCRALIKYFQALQSASDAVLYFVSNPNARKLLSQCDVKHHLLSYAILRRQRDGTLQRYVEGQT